MTRSTTAIFRANGSAFIQEMQKMGNSTVRLERGVNQQFAKMERRFQTFARAAGGLFAGVSTVRAVQQLGTAAEAYTRIGNNLNAAGINAEDFRSKLLATAIESRAPIEALAKSLSRLQFIRPDDGADLNLERVATLNRLIVATGRSAAEANSVVTQAFQSIQSGFLAGDELRSLREAAPPQLLQAIAREVGATVGELKQLGSEGKITADAVLRAIDSTSKLSKELLAQTELTVAQASTNVQSAFVEIAGAVDRELGASSSVAQSLNGFALLMQGGTESAELLAKSFLTVLSAAGALGGAAGIAGVTRAIRSANQAAREQSDLAKTNAKDLRDRLAQTRLNTAALEKEAKAFTRSHYSSAAYKKANDALNRSKKLQRQLTLEAGRAEKVLEGAMKRVTFAARAQTFALNGIKSAIAFFGGVPGLLFTAATALLTFASAGRDADAAVSRFASSMDNAGEAADKASDLQGNLVTLTGELEAAEARLKTAIEARDQSAQTAAQTELKDIRERIAANRENLGVVLDELEAKNKIARQNENDATEQLIRDGQPGFFDTPIFDPNYNFAAAAQDQANALAGGIETLKTEYQDLLDRAGDLTRKERERIPLLEEQIARVASLEEREAFVNEARAKGLVTTKETTAAVAETGETVTTVTTKLTTMEAELAKIAARHQSIQNLLSVQRDLQDAITVAQENGQTEKVALLEQALANVNAQLDRMGVAIAGSSATIAEMAVQAANAVIQMEAIGLDEDDAVYNKAVELRDKLLEMEAAALDVDAVTMNGLRGELDSVVGSADAAALALNKARAEAIALSRDTAQALAHRQRFEGEEAVFAQPVTGPGGTQLVRTPPPAPTPTSPGGGGRTGGRSSGSAARNRALEEENELLKRVDSAIKTAQQSEEQRLSPLQRIRQLREELIATYPNEIERINELDGALQGLEDQARRTFAEGLKDDIFEAIRAGEDFDDILKRIGTSLLELALNKGLENLNAGLGLFGQKAAGGSSSDGFLSKLFGGSGGGGFLGGLFSGIGSLFGFAKGGVMGPSGPVPLRSYAKGGIASSPQLALFGEGSGAEAYVPLENGAIPVRLQLPDLGKLSNAADSSRNVKVTNVNVSQTLNVDGGNMSIDDIRRKLQPDFARHGQQVVKAVRDANEDDPRFLT